MKSGTSMLAGLPETTRHVLWRIYNMHMLSYFQLPWKWNWGRNKLNGTFSKFRSTTLRSYVGPPAFWVLVFWTPQSGNYVRCDIAKDRKQISLCLPSLINLLCYTACYAIDFSLHLLTRCRQATHWDITKKQWLCCSPLWTANPGVAKTTF